MKYLAVKLAVGCLVGVMTVGTYTAPVQAAAVTEVAGIEATAKAALSLADFLKQQSLVVTTSVETRDVPVVTSEFAHIGVSDVSADSYINIRSKASTDSEVVGKLYANSAVTVLGTEGEWYQITSGNCAGYIKSDFIITGDEELAKSIRTRVAIVQTENLNVRKEMSTESEVIGSVSEGTKLIVLEELEGWVKVENGSKKGYVSADYVSCKNYFKVAETIEEEEARLEAEAKAKAEAAKKKNNKNKNNTTSSKKENSSSNKTYNPPSGGSGKAVADYASQFVGNPYRYGGTSLTKGTDCSGFVQSVYKAFGVSLPRTSKQQRSVGYSVSLSEIKPGDIVCYSGHVGIYVGNNTIVHASSKKEGIKFTSPVNYKKIITIRRIY